MNDHKLPVIVNRGGGAASAAGDDLADQLKEAFESAGARADIRLVEGDAIPAAIREGAREGRVVVAGGDGTAASAAQALKGSGAALALLPLGTLNHLARDLGIPSDLKAAAALAATGTATPIDVGEVNGRRFVNNASIGLYPFLVDQRDAVQERRGWSKRLATLPAAWAALSRLPHHRLILETAAGRRKLDTPLLFVGNNRYAIEPGRIGTRASLTDGTLSVFAIAHRTRLALLWFAIRALFGFTDRKADFVAIGECRDLTVHSSTASIDIALDGEVLRLKMPLRFTLVEAALNIVAPAPASQGAEAQR